METEARDFIASRLRDAGLAAPRAGVVLGSGLGKAAPDLEGAVELNCRDVPGWPECGVPGHAGTLRLGICGSAQAMVQMGRAHYYEGLDMEEVTFPMRVMGALGIEEVFMANAAGALNPAYERGYLMLVRDHINLMGENPMRGMRDEEGNPAFLDVSSLYDTEKGDRLTERGKASEWFMEGGVLVAVSGPTYETGAELRYMRLVGGDAISMSLVPEALVAHYLGLSVTAVSVITNVWDMRQPQPVSHQEVLDTAAAAGPVLKEVITAWLEL